MSSPRERVLTETIKNYLMGIQNSKEIYKEYSKLENKVIRMSRKEIDKCAKRAAVNVEEYVVDFEKRNKRPPSPRDIKRKIRRELDNL